MTSLSMLSKVILMISERIDCDPVVTLFIKNTMQDGIRLRKKSWINAVPMVVLLIQVPSSTKEGAVIRYDIKKTEEKVLPEATFTFSCQAGLIIF
ncbi:hypothetical protein [Escherichia coli]|uniref:hypothetical protein n=1 Tax=Escherichia coli TaxID=562 RepID=UPI0018DFDEDA